LVELTDDHHPKRVARHPGEVKGVCAPTAPLDEKILPPIVSEEVGVVAGPPLENVLTAIAGDLVTAFRADERFGVFGTHPNRRERRAGNEQHR
jgi:hypothetical protein